MAPARNTDLDAAIALTRFGLGARPGELRNAAADPRGYLKSQIRAAGAGQPASPPGGKLLSTVELYAREVDHRRAKRAGQVDRAASQQERREIYHREFLARAILGTQTAAGFRERWALMWCNHFSTTKKAHSQATVGSFEREALRPRVFGRFEDLLLASTRHPTMLMYLDQAKSVGPHSARAGTTRRGLNENFARELMELHTLGVDAGYTQNDVTEFAKALTGWTISGHRRGGAFEFDPELHEPGARQIFGKRYAQTGEDQATAVLRDFAASPHTAHHLANRIARHFVADKPPQSLVAKLAAAYRDSNGRLDRVAEALIDAPESWDPAAHKFKTPYEFVLSSWRAAGQTMSRFADLAKPLQELGQKPFMPPSPEGWDEEAENWAGPAAIMSRISWANDFAQRHAPAGDPVKVARDALGARLTTAGATAIARAESRNEAFALLLMTSEFQRR